ncbi:hypothetical protein [Pseudomonas viridiflava]|uniref:hypothetical protein n=1 Tax=Pseudomonas viridiflava TaxID=33069 RepID=UPI001C31B888|nr:hypothetical protein [Pseudomonas viridiflava]QXG29544.1 hypothetical protein KTT59_21590 [Pseudomonas viridiflava]
MYLDYLLWAFKRSLNVTLIYVIACLAIWIFLGLPSGWIVLAISVATWVLYFSVYVKDRRTDQRYYNEHRDRFL